jgi:hypothetical protein
MTMHSTDIFKLQKLKEELDMEPINEVPEKAG